ncbi:hypothetical protein AVEN_219461-1 [Araneus ventricosus]|uniref:Uncharacterized protein n=1 Tax=Araneus ventricosus TaxID=182803 RepID=A0A4Y2BMY7_ARAVE|nr:hypothetical protein AVEN_219461-1 [Araneus ventricosus]
MSHQEDSITGGSHRYVPSGREYHRWLAPIYPIRRGVPPVARTDIPSRKRTSPGGSHRYQKRAYHRWLAPYVTSEISPVGHSISHRRGGSRSWLDMSPSAERTTGGSHRYVPSGREYHRWLAPICPIRRGVPPVARTDMSHQAERTTGDSHLYVTSGRKYHQWIADISHKAWRTTGWLVQICPIRKRVSPVARTYMSHQEESITSGSLIYPIRRGVPPVGSYRYVPSGREYHRWLAPICHIRKKVSPVDR